MPSSLRKTSKPAACGIAILATRAGDANDLVWGSPKRRKVLPMGSVAATVVASVTGAQRMNRTALTNIAPDIFRKRLLVEGYFQSDMAESVLRDYFRHITSELGLRTYGDPIIHKTSGQGKDLNEGYDAFVPLIDSGIYIAAWVKPRFLSTILYTCGEFDEDRAVATVRDFFKLADHQAAIF
jgi:S-adenosylmethionine decarboxylase